MYLCDSIKPTTHPILPSPLPRPHSRLHPFCFDRGFRYTKRIRQAVTSRLQSKPGLERYLARQEEMAEDLIKCIQQQQSSSQEVQTLCYRYTIESKTKIDTLLQIHH